VDAPILVAGDALFDLVADAAGGRTRHPGGGPFNTARTIGRLRRPVAFLGRLSTDALGAEHERLLAADGVGLQCVVRTADPTTLAHATLDPAGTATYVFDTAGTAAAGLEAAIALGLLPPRVAALHAGTLGLVLEPLAGAVEAVVERVAATGALVLVDPNVRPAAITDPAAFRVRLARVVGHADVVKVSDEDLAWLHPGRPPVASARALLALGPRVVLLTRGAGGATILTPRGDAPVAAAPTTVADTIGAGDAFGGGFLAWWTSHGLGRDELARDELIADGARFGAVVAARTIARAGASPPWLPVSAAGRPLDATDL